MAISSTITRVFGRITEFFTTQTNAMSYQLRSAGAVWSRRIRSALKQPSKDWGRANYQYWRNAYYCRTKGLEISALFIKPITSKISAWTLGMGIDWRAGNDATQTALTDWWTAHHPQIMRAMRGSLKQGDAFVVVNADLTITVLPPDTVDPIVDENDYGSIIGWRVTEVLAHPETTQRMTVTDEYYADRRVQRIERPDAVATTRTYPNLIGRLPIVHIANALDEGDTFGHPEAEALVELLLRYNTILEAAIDGNERQGRPTPVLSFETVADMDKFWADYGSSESQTLPDGTSETVTTIGVDLTQILTVAGANFKYESPGSFTTDTEKLLGLLFYLLLEHTEIPEFVFGNAIASSMASANTQMPIFERFIQGRREDAANWLVEVAEVVLGYLSLIQPGVSRETPTIQWERLTQDGALTLQVLVWAFTEGLIDERTALMLSPLDVENIDDVLSAAKAEREQRMAEAQALLPDTTPAQSDQNNDQDAAI